MSYTDYQTITTVDEYEYCVTCKNELTTILVSALPYTQSNVYSGVEVEYKVGAQTYTLGLSVPSGQTSAQDSRIKITYSNASNLGIIHIAKIGTSNLSSITMTYIEKDEVIVQASPLDITQTQYSPALSDVVNSAGTHYMITSVTYANCTELITPPIIPDTVTWMGYAFCNCTKLTTAPSIPLGVTDMQNCFCRCTSLVVPPIIQYDYYSDIYIEAPLTNMSGCFDGCTSLITPPQIPFDVEDISHCFYGCTSLQRAPVIPNRNIKNMDYCFTGCTSLTGDIYMLASATDVGDAMRKCFLGTTQPITLIATNYNVSLCERLAKTSANGNICVNVHSETSIDFNDAQMNYMTSNELKSLSLQTNANLVQCEVPDLVNGGTITTNVSDALIDLYTRGVIVEYEYLVSGAVDSNGITITNNRNGSFTINGTARDFVSLPLLRVTLNPLINYMLTGGYAQTLGTGTYVTGVMSDDTTFGGDGSGSTESMPLPSGVISATIYFRVVTGDTINNITIKPRIVRGGGA